ncbi:MAG: hypothetical protein GTO53_14290 [Planctomycetales bacterium]|nr:hypothetical protein [Planctomycetales bacterium]NIM10255.1 hypothetical protein [Planctomycetales bacterium]NIN09693.1 hypothetical protein [Planctomycetales bacterium]NIN78813.1 hypothetical protein [Planctomycetales bacterium]NIO35984.1 hypothetical protein [Planctomycetales bacterium]
MTNAQLATGRSFYTMSALAIVCLIGLRMSIGWYFFNGAREKNLNRDFTSATFLSGSEGFLAEWFKAGLPDYHGWNRLMVQPLEDKPNPHDAVAEPEQWRRYQQRAYVDWYRMIIDDWGRYKQNLVRYYAFDQAQQDKARQIFAYYDGRLGAHFDDTRGELVAYRHELFRQQVMAASRSARETPFEQQRIDSKQAEARAKAWQIRGEVEEIERQYRQELKSLATADQQQRLGEMPEAKSGIERFDAFVKYSHFAIGGCLLVGLLTRLAAFGAGTFLLMVILSRPPWTVGYQMVGYQIIMMFGCFLIMGSPAGRWAGLDYFLHPWLSNCCRPSSQGDTGCTK